MRACDHFFISNSFDRAPYHHTKQKMVFYHFTNEISNTNSSISSNPAKVISVLQNQCKPRRIIASSYVQIGPKYNCYSVIHSAVFKVCQTSHCFIPPCTLFGTDNHLMIEEKSHSSSWNSYKRKSGNVAGCEKQDKSHETLFSLLCQVCDKHEKDWVYSRV